MKILFTHLALFLIFTVIFSACSTAHQEPVSENNAASPANTTAEKKSSEYPPMPAAIMQSDVKTVEGETFKLENKKGNVLLLNLWATWCGPCRAEMPSLVEMQEKYRGQNFEIIGLNIDDESAEQIKPFAEEMKLNYTLAWAEGDMANGLMRLGKSGGAIPQSFLIDREGHLRGVFIGGSQKVVGQMKQEADKLVNE